MPAQITIPIGSKSARLEVRTKANIHLRSSDERISAKRISADPNTDKMVYEITAEDTRKELQNVVITLDNPYTGQVAHPPPRARVHIDHLMHAQPTVSAHASLFRFVCPSPFGDDHSKSM